MSTVAVIGAGLAGTTAALAARAGGADVVLLADRPGASALWSGVAEIFGPIYDRVDHQDPLGRPHLVATGQPPLEDRAARLGRLLRRRSFHPYARLALSLAELDRLAREAATLLDLDLGWPDEPTYVANVHGTARLADGAWSSVAHGALSGERRYCLIGFEHFPLFSADAAARALEAQGLRASASWLGVEGAGLAQSPAVASARLEALDDGALRGLGTRIAALADGGVALVPPILGRSLAAHARTAALLAEGAGDTVIAELASTHRSLHGFRLHLALEARLAAAGVERRSGQAASTRADDGRVTAVELASGERIEVDALVLATGRAIGGGVRREHPLGEALLDLPLYIEGAPVEPGQYPPELATRRLFDDHPLFRLGVGVSPALRPLGTDARPRFENVWACGLLLGGTDFTRDGSAFGVGLVTGLLAGRRAAGAEG